MQSFIEDLRDLTFGARDQKRRRAEIDAEVSSTSAGETLPQVRNRILSKVLPWARVQIVDAASAGKSWICLSVVKWASDPDCEPHRHGAEYLAELLREQGFTAEVHQTTRMPGDPDSFFSEPKWNTDVHVSW